MKRFGPEMLQNAGTVFIAAFLLTESVFAQVNSGSDGSDGVLNPTTDIIIAMADHPDGIYNYTSVDIPAGVTVSFTPNAVNTPVVWLVQGDCMILGNVSLAGAPVDGAAGKPGGPGGYRGGNAPSMRMPPIAWGRARWRKGCHWRVQLSRRQCILRSHWRLVRGDQHPPGEVYGNEYCVPLVGGSGGGGGLLNAFHARRNGGGGGGGAILIAASGKITVDGSVSVDGGGVGSGDSIYELGAGGGSEGAIRLGGDSRCRQWRTQCFGRKCRYTV